MKPHLEARNKRLREEYSTRKHHEDAEDIFDSISIRENLSRNTVRIICQTAKYGTYNHSHLNNQVDNMKRSA